MENSDFIRQSVIRDMAEGLLTIDLQGVITYANPAACDILGFGQNELTGHGFASVFFGFEENDAFNETVIDSVYDADNTHENIVPYYDGTQTKQLHIRTSFLKQEEKKVGIIAVISDITELAGLRDAVKAMQEIRTLNGKLEMRNRLLSETFGRFLSDEIVSRLLDTPDGLRLGGKKTEITVLMSDLRGFTAYSMVMEAHDLLAMLNHYLGEMTDVIRKYGGTIIEFIGDGILAVFGAPEESRTHAADALACAVEMQTAMANVNAYNEEKGYPVLEMGIGVNTGEVIVGNIGSEKRTKYGVTGSEVNLCGRIESYTVGGQVLAAESTLNSAGVNVETDVSLDIKPKGVGKTVRVYGVRAVGGRYAVRYDIPYAKAEKLAAPVAADFYILSGKHEDTALHAGAFTALSADEAVFSTGTALEIYDNLKFDISTGLFGKITGLSADGYTVRFTSRPSGFTGKI